MKKVTVTEDQIAEWKDKHGDVFEVEIGEKNIFLKKPTRQVVALAATKGKTNQFEFVDVIIKNCQLGGDDLDPKDVGELLGFSQILDELMEVKRAELKKK